MYDVLVIGGGVVGTLVLRELAKYDLSPILLEAGDDVAVGASRANSGIVHAGYDCEPGTKKAFFNVKGHAMYPSLVAELDVPYAMTGSLVVANESGKKGIEALYEKGIANGVKVEIIDKRRIRKLEPNVANDISVALYAPEAGIVSPYKLTIAAADSAIINGATVAVSQKVTAVEKIDGGYKVVTEDGEYEAKIVINSAGANAVAINKLLGEREEKVDYKRGDYFVLDKSEINAIHTVLFPLPDEKGKGILVAPTADGNVIYGPTSVVTDVDDTAVTKEGLDQIRAGIAKTYKTPNYRKIIRVFAGLRSAIGHDFIIEESEKNEGYIMLLGICSPGLTSAPAIADYVVNTLVAARLPLNKKAEWKVLPKHVRINKLTPDEMNSRIEENPLYGRVICRCETVTEGEIVDAIHSPLPATTVDAVKRRVRAGMGRCQGGFCMPSVIKILSRELNIPLTEVKKGGDNSEIAVERIEVNQ